MSTYNTYEFITDETTAGKVRALDLPEAMRIAGVSDPVLVFNVTELVFCRSGLHYFVYPIERVLLSAYDTKREMVVELPLVYNSKFEWTLEKAPSDLNAEHLVIYLRYGNVRRVMLALTDDLYLPLGVTGVFTTAGLRIGLPK